MTTIIYHKINEELDCPDGIASAYVTSLVYPNAEIVGCCYNGQLPTIPDNEEVIIVDFSFSKDILEGWADRGCQITVIDHHKTAMNHLFQVSNRILQKFDMEECGASLTWKYFFPDKPIRRIREDENPSINRRG